MKAHAPLPIRILTHNIRYATDSPFKGEKPWLERKDLIINELKFSTLHNPEAFICLQEVLHEQLLDILAGLNSTSPTLSSAAAAPPGHEQQTEKQPQEWTYIGVGRTDGHQAGEYSPILFRPRIWHVQACRTVWLSPTPDRPGKGWDAGSIRIVTVGTFVHQESRKRVVGLCTHFDEQGAVSRRESARIIERLVDEETVPSLSSIGGTVQVQEQEQEQERTPVWLAGDLNSEPDGEAYAILNGRNSLLRDSRALAKWKYGNDITCTGFQKEEMSIIDYVFVGRHGWVVEGFSVLGNRFDAGVYCSDHRAVVVDAVLHV